MINRHFAPSILAAIGLFAFVQILPASSIGPIGVYYATDFSSGTIYAIRGNSVAQTAEVDPPYEGPIAVLPNETVATTGYFSPRPGITAQGATYTGVPGLILTPSGATAAQQLSVAYDGTTNGTQNFAVDQNSGGVYSFGLDWSDPQPIFTTGGADDSVITYEAANNSLWIQNEDNLTLTDYTLAGAVVSSFTPAATGHEGLALAMDVDGTLWFSDYGTNTLEHYATDGTNLGSFTFTNLDGATTLGAPFFNGAEIGGAVPEPGTMLLLALPMVALSWRRLSRAGK
jgi:hypothetical protein